MDPKNHRFPYCIVWTPLPLISAILPFIGHTGICCSEGVIHDFAGSFYISEDQMAFGWPTKYNRLKPNEAQTNLWDEALSQADADYRKVEHNLCCDNCHSHVARFLNLIRYRGKSDWSMLSVWLLTWCGTSYVSCGAFLRTYVWSAILYGIIGLMCAFTF